MSLLPPGEPESALSVIREATDENYASSALFHFPLIKSKVALEEEPVEALPPETMMQTKYTMHAKDGETNQFRTVVLAGKQPYSSCCCVTF